MFDAQIRPFINPPLNFIGTILARTSISANVVTWIGFSFGLLSLIALSQGHYSIGGILFLLNRFFDGVDGGVARANGVTDYGGFLDIVTDFIIYPGIPFSIALSNSIFYPWATFVLFSMSTAMTTFLAFAIVAQKKGLETSHQGKKSFFYMSGLCEGAETVIALSLMCFFISYFPYIACTFAILCLFTTFGRMIHAYQILNTS